MKAAIKMILEILGVGVTGVMISFFLSENLVLFLASSFIYCLVISWSYYRYIRQFYHSPEFISLAFGVMAFVFVPYRVFILRNTETHFLVLGITWISFLTLLIGLLVFAQRKN